MLYLFSMVYMFSQFYLRAYVYSPKSKTDQSISNSADVNTGDGKKKQH